MHTGFAGFATGSGAADTVGDNGGDAFGLQQIIIGYMNTAAVFIVGFAARYAALSGFNCESVAHFLNDGCTRHGNVNYKTLLMSELARCATLNPTRNLYSYMAFVGWVERSDTHLLFK